MRKNISFVTAGLSFNGNSLKERALGGSESAMILLARELAALDNSVTVYCDCDVPGIYDGVEYRHYSYFGRDENISPDVLVVSRFTDFLSVPMSPKMTVLWCHDTDVADIYTALGQVDQVYCLSEFQRQLYSSQYNIPQDLITKTTNGYDANIEFESTSFNVRKNNFIYASRPERGLKLLLEKIWPKIIETNPKAKLHICGYANNINISEELVELYSEIDELLEYSQGIVKVGELTKSEYYNLLGKCSMMLYPTDFPEISCINAIEAQHCGCLVISSAKYALTETVRTPTLICGEVGSDEYIKLFVRKVFEIDEKRYNFLLDDLDISCYDWANVASSWNHNMEYFFNRNIENSDKVIDQLVYNSDLVAAWKLTSDATYRAMLDKAEHDNHTSSDFTYSEAEDDYFCPRNIELIRAFEDKIATNPDKKLKVVDLGSNQGILSLPLLKRYSDNIESMTLFDSCGPVLDQVKTVFGEKYPQLKTINDSLLNISNYDFDADVVILGEILEHIEDTVQFLNFLTEHTCGENTTYFFTVPTGPWESIIKEKYGVIKDIHHVHHFELADIREIFADVNPTITLAKTGVLGRRGEPCDNFCFWYTGNRMANFYEPNYTRKINTTRPYKTVSVSIIAKNEEDNLSRCLKSIYKFADEIIVVDTGSTDTTIDIAQRYTDKVFKREWRDFASARNYSIEKASGDYIFWIDCDEELVNSEILFNYIKSDYYSSVVMSQKQLLTKESWTGGTNCDIPMDRLFKNNIGIKFIGCVHEFPSENGRDFIDSRIIYQPHSFVLHYGGANSKLVDEKTLSRNSNLIYKNLEEYPMTHWFKHYVLQDFWNRFSLNGDTDYIKLALHYFNTEIIPTGDKETIEFSLKYLQFILRNAYYSDTIIDGYEISAYDKNSTEFYAFSDEQAELFGMFIG